jgi:hypothetical protein
VTQQPDPWSGEPFDAPQQGTSVPSGPVVPPDGKPAHPGYLPSVEPVPVPPVPHEPRTGGSAAAESPAWSGPTPSSGTPGYPGPSYPAGPSYPSYPGYPPAQGNPSGYPGYPPAQGYSAAQGYPASPAYSPSPGYPPGQSDPGYAQVGSAPPAQGYGPGPAPMPGYPPAGVGLRPTGVPFTPASVPPPPPDGRWKPYRIQPVAGTEFGLMQLEVPPVASGQATGSLIAGIGSILVSVLVLCFGVTGASRGWGGWVAGAFTVPGVLVGAGAIALGLVARRQIRGSGHHGRIRFTGRGRATAGIACGAAGAGLSLLSLALGLLLQLS